MEVRAAARTRPALRRRCSSPPNPIYLMFAVAGSTTTSSCWCPRLRRSRCVLSRRDRSAGAALMIAVAVKFTAMLLLPFLLIAAWPTARRVQRARRARCSRRSRSRVMYLGAVRVLGPQPCRSEHAADRLGASRTSSGWCSGSAAARRRCCGSRMSRCRGDRSAAAPQREIGCSDAGWSTLALIASLAWLVPWYVIWLLPLAALGTSVKLRRAALVVHGIPRARRSFRRRRCCSAKFGINLMDSPAGQASTTLQHKLAQ